MSLTKSCRSGRHAYDALVGAGAGLGRRRCTICGSIQIDLTEEVLVVDNGSNVFAPRRPTLFSVRDESQGKEEAHRGFGRHFRRK